MNGERVVADRITIYCTRCGKAMTVVREHYHRVVGCPHCGQHLQPWRALGEAAAPVPPPPQGTGPWAPPPRQVVPAYQRGTFGPGHVSSRNRLVAGLLGIFLGGFGVHRFYLGYIGIGVIQILLTLFTGIGLLWGFIEGIVCLCGGMKDADGLPLRD